MHFPSARIAHHLHDLHRSCAADDAVVDQDDPLALDQGAIGIVLQLDAQVADVLAWLDEGPPDIVGADDAKFERDLRFLAEAERGGNAGIRDGNDEVGLDRRLARQLRADVLAHLIDRRAFDDAVGPREIDMFEDAGRGLGRCERPEAAHACSVDDDQLARLDVAQIAGADHVERDGFRSEDGRFAELAHHQRADAERVAAGDQPFGRQAKQGICALDLAERVGQPVERCRVARRRDEVDDHLGVAGRLEDRAAADQRGAQASWHSTRLPLWATAKPPSARSANNGWTLRSAVSPVVE